MSIVARMAGEFTCHQTLALDEPRPCIGPRCMAWVWERPPEGLGPNMATWHGYCGLIGDHQCKR